MSHFTVLVIGDNPEKQLAPYHEFECTGTDDQYVQDIDQTDELRAEYEASSERKLKDPNGNLHEPHDDQFYRDPTEEEIAKHGIKMGTGGNSEIFWYSKDWGDGKGYRAKIKFIPEGYEQVEVKTSESETFAQWLKDYHGRSEVAFGSEPDLADEHKYGYTLLDEAGEVLKTIDRTNPNRKWDWWTIGGRWTGFFKLKEGAQGEAGRPGLMTGPAEKGWVDQCRKDAIDIEGTIQAKISRRMESYRAFHAILNGREIPSWETTREKHQGDIEAARTEYASHPVVHELRKAHFFDWDDLNMPEGQFIEGERKDAIRTFAVVKDGKWYEKGEMGWWGVVHEEMDANEWRDKFAELFDSLPGDTLLTIVDCHI